MVVSGPPSETPEGGRSSAFVRATGVRFAYGNGDPVLKGVDLEIGAGEIVGIAGPRGSGKSTLLRMLAGDLAPDAGTLELPPRRSAGGRTMLGYAADEDAHFEELSGFENALFFARAGGLRRGEAEASVREHFAALGLADQAGRPVRRYSIESRRRLLLVEALVYHPALILLDSPFNGLDADTVDALVHVLRLRSARRSTVVVACNDLGLLPELADRLVFLHEGRVVRSGRVAELLASVGPKTRIEIELEKRPHGGEVRFRPEIAVVDAGDPFVVETTRGQVAVGEACAALTAAGAVIRSVAVRDPDLAEVFRQAAGAPLDA